MPELRKGVKGFKRTLALIIVLCSAPPIATDLYLPALPQMPGIFNAPESLVSLTLVGFFLFMAIGTLVFGPVSDKYGRKKPLLVATVMFSVFGLLSGLATNIWILVVARVFQGIGGGGMVALSMALVKDCFTGRVREKVLVFIQAMGVIAPMCAPMMGSVILEFFDWRATFFAQAILGFASLALVLPMIEPLEMKDRIQLGVVRAMGRLFVVGKNRSFLLILLMTSILALPFMGYISCISYIYIDYFGLSTFGYSVLFAINAGLSVVGAGLALVLSGRVPVKTIISGIIVLSIVSGVLVVGIGHFSPILFLLAFGIYSLTGSVSRPFTTNIMLEQQDGDTGSASSLINFVFNISGSLGMVIAVMPWPTYIFGLGFMIALVSVIALTIWIYIRRAGVVVRGL